MKRNREADTLLHFTINNHAHSFSKKTQMFKNSLWNTSDVNVRCVWVSKGKTMKKWCHVHCSVVFLLSRVSRLKSKHVRPFKINVFLLHTTTNLELHYVPKRLSMMLKQHVLCAFFSHLCEAACEIVRKLCDTDDWGLEWALKIAQQKSQWFLQYLKL